MPAHLPMLATRDQGPFAINLAGKGLGLPPGPGRMEQETRRLEQSVHDPTNDVARKVKAMASFYSDPANFDRNCLGGLDMFAEKMVENEVLKPLGSLWFTGPGPRYLSFHFKGVLEKIETTDPRYRFLHCVREPFAHDGSRMKQARYRIGYLFHISESLIKTPFSRC